MSTNDPDDWDGPDDDSDDLEEEFLDYVVAFEREEPKDLSVILPEAGVALPPPETLSDSELNAKLWEVINMLSLLGTFSKNPTNLSTGELYPGLWPEFRHDPMALTPNTAPFACHIDMV